MPMVDTLLIQICFHYGHTSSLCFHQFDWSYQPLTQDKFYLNSQGNLNLNFQGNLEKVDKDLFCIVQQLLTPGISISSQRKSFLFTQGIPCHNNKRPLYPTSNKTI